MLRSLSWSFTPPVQPSSGRTTRAGVPFTADTSTSLAAAAAAPVFTWTGSCEVHRTAPVGRSLFLERLSEQEELDWDSLGACGGWGKDGRGGSISAAPGVSMP